MGSKGYPFSRNAVVGLWTKVTGNNYAAEDDFVPCKALEARSLQLLAPACVAVDGPACFSLPQKTKTNTPLPVRHHVGAIFVANPGSGELCHDALGPSLCTFALLPFQSIYHTPSPPLTLLRPFIQLAFCLLRPYTLTSLRPPSETPLYLDPATRFILYQRSVAIKSEDTRTPIVSRRAPTHALVVHLHILLSTVVHTSYGEIVSFSVPSPYFIA